MNLVKSICVFSVPRTASYGPFAVAPEDDKNLLINTLNGPFEDKELTKFFVHAL